MTKNHFLKCAQTISVLAMFFLFSISGFELYAQIPSPTPEKSEEEKRLEEKKRISDLRKSIAENEKAELSAKFPTSSSSPLEGKTEVNDDAVIESRMVAYVAMARAANSIIDSIKSKPFKIKNLAIYNEEDVNLMLSYKMANNQISIIKQSYCTILEPSATGSKCPAVGTQPLVPPAAALSIARSFLGGFVDLTALLRTNVVIKGETFDIDESPLVSEVFRAARAGTGLKFDDDTPTTLYYPRMFPPDINPNGDSEILGRLQEIYELRSVSEYLISAMDEKSKEIKKTEGSIKTLENSIKEISAQENMISQEANNFLEAYCRRTFAQNLSVLDKLQRVGEGRGCRVTPEVRERALKLRESIKNTIKASQEAVQKKFKEEENLKTFRAELETIKSQFKDSGANDAIFNSLMVRLGSVNAQFDSFTKSLVEVNATTGVNPLTSFIKAENLRAVLFDRDQQGNLSTEHAYWLQLKVVKAGGNNRIKTNLIWDIFTGGNRLSHSGGAIIEYNLFDSTGRSVASDTLTQYTKYIKSGKIKDLPSMKTKRRRNPEKSEVDDLIQ